MMNVAVAVSLAIGLDWEHEAPCMSTQYGIETRKASRHKTLQERGGMMKRTYIQLSRAWYGKTCITAYSKLSAPVVDEISIKAGGSEFVISWKRVVDLEDVSELQVFDEAWGILVNDCADLLKELALLADTAPSPDCIAEVLEGLGFEDKTQEKEE